MSRKARPDLHYPEISPLARQVMRYLAVAMVVAAALATVFTAWTPAGLSPGELASQLAAALERRPDEENALEGIAGQMDGGVELTIGIVVGHAGPHPNTGLVDPGATCPDGLTELQVNREVGELVQKGLQAAGLYVDLLDEWDDRLYSYRAVALVSIHADACIPINDQATGYKVTAAMDTAVLDKAQRLVACMVDRYGRATDLRYHPGSITRDMTEYHTFNEIHSQTPAVVIEIGFLYLDRELLTKDPAKVARGITEGILCYVNNEPADLTWENRP
jgi:N-acetylmuramoyl-L-alanine amidase